MKYKWPIIGHSLQLESLEQDIEQGRLSHAYLLAGPNQLGKRLVAVAFAQILQCPNNFCKECPTCKQIEQGQHIDTFERRDDGESFKIEEMRELLSHLSTTTSSRYKIVILQNIERVTPEAANAFLKTLEEPIPGVIFILTTTKRQQLIDTIISRTRVISLHALSEKTIRDYLKQTNPSLDETDLNMMAAFSMGKPGRALKFLNDPDVYRFYQDVYHQIAKFLERSLVTDRMMYAEEISKDPESMIVFFELFSHLLRRLIMKKMEGEQISYRFDELFGMVDFLQQARFELDHNVNPRMVLENLMMKF